MSTTRPLMNRFTSCPESLLSGSFSVSCPSISAIPISFFQGSLPGRPLLRRSQALQSSIRSSYCDGTGCTIPDPFSSPLTVLFVARLHIYATQQAIRRTAFPTRACQTPAPPGDFFESAQACRRGQLPDGTVRRDSTRKTNEKRASSLLCVGRLNRIGISHINSVTYNCCRGILT